MSEWKEYNYSGEYSEIANGIVYRPMIAAKLIKDGQEYNCFSLIDSGTESTMFSADFAKLLGIDESKCKKVRVGSIEKDDSFGFVSKIKLQLENFEEVLETEVIFLRNMAIGGLLGQKDIFEDFKIRFEKKHKKFYLAKEK